MRGMLSQIRFQAIIVALVPIAVLAAMLAYTIATRNSTALTAFWADHTQRVIEANDALTNALTEENRRAALYHDTAGFERARRETNRRATALLAAANATPDEQRQAQIYVQHRRFGRSRSGFVPRGAASRRYRRDERSRIRSVDPTTDGSAQSGQARRRQIRTHSRGWRATNCQQLPHAFFDDHSRHADRECRAVLDPRRRIRHARLAARTTPAQ